MKRVVVFKFGGTSVGTPERINAVAEKVSAAAKNMSPVVVVSAMSGETNRLVGLCQELAEGEIPVEEYHQVVSSGEVVSTGLLSIALKRQGVKSRTFIANKLGLTTSEAYGADIISDFDPSELHQAIKDDVIPVVAGFQGLGTDGRVTTLGRGGSDTTAVAVAAALGGVECRIYTDVPGVFTANPSVVKAARQLEAVSYEEMLELASGGAKVLHTRCVSLARKFQIPLEVLSSFEDLPGTKICNEYEGMENSVVSGISHRPDEVKVSFGNLPDEPGIAAKIFEEIAGAGVNVDMIVQSASKDGRAQISFTINSADLDRVKELGEKVVSGVSDADFNYQTDIAKLSVVGEGMKTHAGIAARMFEVLGKEGINIDMITTSEIKISVAVQSKYCELALRVLHKEFIE